MKSRKQRKLKAKQEGLQFVPQYNGKDVVGYDEFYNVGNERFNNKFVQFDKVEEGTVQDEQVDVIDSDKEYEPPTEEKVEDKPKGKKAKKESKLKKKIKKLFGK